MQDSLPKNNASSTYDGTLGKQRSKSLKRRNGLKTPQQAGNQPNSGR
jgi:hypothetical protein